ncbi:MULTISPECIES: MlaD family protein [unclassified Janthinobacterium]|uniref:MlaD family protein n=1 Tax=unclassified Janthinobacterium TaxID=2610881 RepID=UPI0016121A09|nr:MULTISPECIES: MlaD family protein [unclassified Janthinobacterium]MBB5607033.1 phospholipid/cholesterol/gamma-HCH transport system substrate-binding protein [Janthinobacterium sp. S3T4]MBB5612759.1 phospholipid/cholesterol/gamma-HCH transport system substrate-binding protein [Janthinobacterium sp. S3M3]
MSQTPIPDQTDVTAPDTTLPAPPPVRHAELKAAILLVSMFVLIVGSVLYLMYARGAFEATQVLVLTTDDSDGVVVGADLTFSGFPIGRVQRIELSPDGKARVIIDVPRTDAHWLRTSSIFTLERGIVGGAKLRAYSGILTDPPLPDNASRDLLVGDMAAEIPRLLAAAKDLLTNLGTLTGADSPLDSTLRNVQAVTGKLSGPAGAMGLLTGNDKQSQLLIERANALLLTADQLARRTDGLVANADTRVFGDKGVMTDAQATIVQLNALLADTRNSLKKVDAVLVEAQAVGANAKAATADLGPLRADVESNLRKVEQLVNEINRKWPFKRNPEIKLP